MCHQHPHSIEPVMKYTFDIWKNLMCQLVHRYWYKQIHSIPNLIHKNHRLLDKLD